MAGPERRTTTSQNLWERAKRSIPGGTHNPAHYLSPHPLYFDRAEGAYVFDVDGNRYLDLKAGQTALPLGNDPADVTKALVAQIDTLFSLTNAHPAAIELAEVICDRVPSVDKVLFTDSGLKASQFAVRLARRITGRQRFAKFRGGYHGSWDGALFATRYGTDPMADDIPVGVPASAAADIVLLPFNDPDACERIIGDHADELNSIILEPVLGDGYLPPAPGFLELLRTLCDRHGILLVFDEVITLSLAPGGAQEHYGVLPDLTAMGKVIGGGLPIGAIGGTDAVMEYADPGRPEVPVPFGTTFGGHPLAVAAGLAQFELLTPAVYDRLHQLGDRARRGIDALGVAPGVEVTATGVGHLMHLHWNPAPIVDYADHARCDDHVLDVITAGLIRRGYVPTTYGRCHFSAAMTDDDIDGLVEAVAESIGELPTG